MKKLLVVVGTRPNFIKITQFKKLAKDFPQLELKIVHTGQHYTASMSDVFFQQFNLEPDYFLNIDGATPLKQIAQILIELENLINTKFFPDLIITPGDVNSTLAVALVANKLNIPLAHLESGLRSFDREMPEEINRVLTDEISQHFFVTEKSGIENLRQEQKLGQIHFVGNTMIDTLVAYESEIDRSTILHDLKINGEFVLMTMHRPSNVDDAEGLKKLYQLVKSITLSYQLIFPVHPRTRKNLKDFGFLEDLEKIENLILVDSLGYFEFQKLIKHCKFVLTDSGGIQEETTYRRIPCLTLRTTTERPITVELGSNTLVPFSLDLVSDLISDIEKGTYKTGQIPDLWDGQSTFRILSIIDKMEL